MIEGLKAIHYDYFLDKLLIKFENQRENFPEGEKNHD